MSLTHEVPPAVQKAALRGLKAHRASDHAVNGVRGVSVAEALSNGHVAFDLVRKVHLYFSTNFRAYTDELYQLRTEDDSPVVRSWLLHGGEAGKAWAASIYKAAVQEDDDAAEPLIELFKLRPEEVYPRFALGAWRYEYGLDPNKAARFVEQYMRETGLPFDLRQAFGNAAEAVGNAVYRRVHTPNPFRELFKAMMVDDLDYKTAAEIDLAEVAASIPLADRMDEAFAKNVFTTMNPAQAAKLVWAPFVAYFILAVEAPDILADMNVDSKKPPPPFGDSGPYTLYHDAINTYIAYFHNEGARYKTPAVWKKPYENLEIELYDALKRAYYGKKLLPTPMKKLLGRARQWTAGNKQAGSLFHVFLADWKKGNWQHILDKIAVSADVRPYFEKFVKGNPMPKGGLKLQQTLTSKRIKDEIVVWLAEQGYPNSKPTPVKMTDSGKAASAAGTPLGINGLMEYAGKTYTYLGAWKSGPAINHVFRNPDGVLERAPDFSFAAQFELGKVKVVQAHKDMPGSAYQTTDQSVAPESPAEKEQTDPIMAMLQDVFPDFWQQFTEITMSTTAAYKLSATMFAPLAMSQQSRVLNVKTNEIFTILTAFETPEGNIIVYRNPDNEITWDEDETFVEQFELGNIKLISTTAPTTTQPQTEPVEPPEDEKLTIPQDVLDHFVTNFGYDPDTLTAIPVGITDFGKQAKAISASYRRGTKWVWIDTIIEIVGAVKMPNGEYRVVFRYEDGTIMSMSDLSLVGAMADGTLHIYSEENDAKPIPLYEQGDVIKHAGEAPAVVMDYGPDTDEYLLISLEIGVGGEFPFAANREVVDEEYDIMDIGLTKPLWSSKNLVKMANAAMLLSPYLPVAKPENWTISPGDVLTVDGEQIIYTRAVLHNVVIFPVFAMPASYLWSNAELSYYRFSVLTSSVVEEMIESSYAPTDPKPEPAAVDAMDEPDSEQADPEMSGTAPALAFVAKKKWTPAVKSDGASFEFEFDLGDKLQYGPTKTRTIIGYAIGAEGKTVYIIFTEKGNINFKTTIQGNQQYGPKIETLQKIVDALQPKPGEKAKAKFPKLNYKLSKHAKLIAEKKNWTYVKSPKKPAFYVGTKLTHIATGGKYRLVAWRDTEPPRAVLHDIESPEALNAKPSHPDSLGLDYEIAYAYTNLIDEDTGEVTFGKGAGNADISIAIAGAVNLPSELPEGWDNPQPINQPPMDEMPSGKHVSAGIVAVIPGGAAVFSGPTNFLTDNPQFVMTHPMNDYAGYTLTFPKGTVDPGESLEKTAVREVWEETGLSVKPVALLGDYKGRTSITRMYIGYVTGGNPKKAGKETDAVTLRSFSLVEQGLPTWAAQLKDRDKKIVADAIAWINASDWPSANDVDAADADSAVTGPQDAEGEAGLVSFDPNASFTYATGLPNQQYGNTDYKVGPLTLNYVKAELEITEVWNWTKQLPLINVGFPPVGAKVTVKDVKANVHAKMAGKEIFVRAYVKYKYKSDVIAKTGMIAHQFESDTYFWLSLSLPGVTTPFTYGPDDFTPVAIEAIKKTKTVPADTGKDDIWRTLLFKAPFPIGQDAIAALKQMSTLEETVPVSFTCTRAEEKGPTYGEAFILAGDTYTALGYVAWTDEDGKFVRWLIAKSAEDQTEVFGATTITAGMFKSAKITAPVEPWFTHPDPDTNQAIQELYANGGKLKLVGIGMHKLKGKWFKEAGVPAYNIATANLVQDIASLFVPGAATKAQYDAVIACLKARMSASHQKKKGKTASTSVDTVSTDVASPIAPAVESVGSFTTVPLDSPFFQDVIDNPKPEEFTSTGTKLSEGSNPNKILLHDGIKYFFKTPKDGDPRRVEAEVAAARLAALVKKNVIPVGRMEFEGQFGSLQPFDDDAAKPFSTPGDHTPSNMAELLSQHAFDMWVGDHDGNINNWIQQKSGKLKAIDRGQAFKFYLLNKPMSLDPTWHAPGNFGEGYAKRLLIDWSKGKTEIPPAAFKAMRKTIDKIQKVTNNQLTAILAELLGASGLPQSKWKTVLNRIKKARDNYLKDWTDVLTKLNPAFEWVVAPVTPPTPGIIQGSPEEQGFTDREEDEIEEAAEAGWEGKSIRVDRDAFEEQAIMVHRVTFKGNDATLLNWRLSKHVADQIASNLMAKAGKIVEADNETQTGPQRLKIDLQNNFWNTIFDGIKNLNYHYLKNEETWDNKEKWIQPALALIPVLTKMKDVALADPESVNIVTNEKNDVIATMAAKYISYCELIQVMYANPKDYIGKHSPQLSEYLYEPTPDDRERRQKEAVKAFEVVYKKSNANLPSTDGDVVNQKGQIKLVSLNGNQVGQNPQFQITTPSGIRIYQIPAEGTLGNRGIGWAFMESLSPTTGLIATILKLFEEACSNPATGHKPLSGNIATPKDSEALFWIKQASALQKGGVFKPETADTSIVEAPLQGAVNKYRQGDTDGAISSLKTIVAKKTKRTVSAITKEAAGMIDGTFSNTGTGWNRHERLGWTRAKFIQEFPKGTLVGHAALEKPAHILFDQLRKNGAIVSNNMKPFVGASLGGGGSVPQDFGSGGSQGIFAGFRMMDAAIGADTFYFDLSLCLRLDVYVIGSGGNWSDAYGKLTDNRATSPAKWAAWAHSNSYQLKQALGYSSPYQVNIRHDIKLSQYLHALVCVDKDRRDKVRAICKEMGWLTFANGRKLNKVVIAKGEAGS